MGKIVQFEYHDIDGEFKNPSAYVLKYPYIYGLYGAKLYRLNVISYKSELIATLSIGALSNFQNFNTDFLYYITYNSSGQLNIYRADVTTFEVKYIKGFVTSPYPHACAKAEIVGENTRIYLYYSDKGSSSSFYSTYYEIFDIDKNGDVISTISKGSYVNKRAGVISLIAPSIVNSNYERLVYCGYDTGGDLFEYYSILKVVGFSALKYPARYGQPLDNKYYDDVSVFELNGNVYGIGGSVYDDSGNKSINDAIIKINLSSFTSEKVSTLKYGNGRMSKTLYDENNAYIVISDTTICVAKLVEYNLTYEFRDKDNNLVLKLVDKLPITNVNVSSDGDNISVTLTYLDSSTEDVNFTLPTYKNFEFSGLSDEQGSRFPMFPIGSTPTSVYTDLILYPTYTRKIVPTTVFTLELYKNKAESNRVDKTDYLTNIGTLPGALRDESSIINPVITVEYLDIPTFNYVYIPIFNRYYFVNDITSVRYKLWQISLSIDTLMTYKDAIMQCVGFIDRNEHEFNAGIIDKKRVIEQGRTMEISSVTNELFTGVEGTFSLCALNATAINTEQ